MLTVAVSSAVIRFSARFVADNTGPSSPPVGSIAGTTARSSAVTAAVHSASSASVWAATAAPRTGSRLSEVLAARAFKPKSSVSSGSRSTPMVPRARSMLTPESVSVADSSASTGDPARRFKPLESSSMLAMLARTSAGSDPTIGLSMTRPRLAMPYSRVLPVTEPSPHAALSAAAHQSSCDDAATAPTRSRAFDRSAGSTPARSIVAGSGRLGDVGAAATAPEPVMRPDAPAEYPVFVTCAY